MQFIENLKCAFIGVPATPETHFGTGKEWFFSSDGQKVLNDANSTVALTDYFYHYLKALNNNSALDDKLLYKVAFIFADSILPSQQVYAGKDKILDEKINPFVAYFKNLKRSLSPKSLCYEMLLILLECVDPFDSTSWLYDTERGGYSEEEYQKFAEEKQIDFRQLLEVSYSEKEDLRLIICEIIWLIGQKDFFKIVG